MSGPFIFTYSPSSDSARQTLSPALSISASVVHSRTTALSEGVAVKEEKVISYRIKKEMNYQVRMTESVETIVS